MEAVGTLGPVFASAHLRSTTVAHGIGISSSSPAASTSIVRGRCGFNQRDSFRELCCLCRAAVEPARILFILPDTLEPWPSDVQSELIIQEPM